MQNKLLTYEGKAGLEHAAPIQTHHQTCLGTDRHGRDNLLQSIDQPNDYLLIGPSTNQPIDQVDHHHQSISNKKISQSILGSDSTSQPLIQATNYSANKSEATRRSRNNSTDQKQLLIAHHSINQPTNQPTNPNSKWAINQPNQPANLSKAYQMKYRRNQRRETEESSPFLCPWSKR